MVCLQHSLSYTYSLPTSFPLNLLLTFIGSRITLFLFCSCTNLNSNSSHNKCTTIPSTVRAFLSRNEPHIHFLYSHSHTVRHMNVEVGFFLFLSAIWTHIITLNLYNEMDTSFLYMLYFLPGGVGYDVEKGIPSACHKYLTLCTCRNLPIHDIIITQNVPLCSFLVSLHPSCLTPGKYKSAFCYCEYCIFLFST